MLEQWANRPEKPEGSTPGSTPKEQGQKEVLAAEVPAVQTLARVAVVQPTVGT